MDSSLVENQARALRIALDNGTLTRDAYAANLIRVKGLAENAAAEKLRTAFVEGRIDADLLDRNLASLHPAPRPEPRPDSESDPIDMPPFQ